MIIDMIIEWIKDFISIGLFLTLIGLGVVVGFGLPIYILYLFLRAVHFLYTGVW